MCGISGVFAGAINEKQKKIIESIVQNQHARGPDHKAIAKLSSLRAEALLGHNRLGIIDLTPQANQPMWDVSERYCITYNGEIYNYIELRDELKQAGMEFRTQGDTEVILNAFALWGIEALNRFNGPFAAGLFDRVSGELWLFRDRFGVRPLYYLMEGDTLYFASSSTVLAESHKLKPDLKYITRGLNYLVYENGDEITPYEGIAALPAGYHLHARLNQEGKLSLTLQKYYDIAERVKELTDTLPLNKAGSLIEKIDYYFEDAVRIRLRSDVPIGISLSSGLDSSAVAALVRSNHENSIGFSYGHPLNKKTEGALVAKCARYLGLKMIYVSPNPHELIEGLFKTIKAQEAPFSTLSVVAQYQLYHQIHASGVKVILGGQGGDESFMGYRKFMFFWIQALLRQKKYFSTFKNMLQLIPMMTSEMTAISVYWKHRHRYFKKTQQDGVLRLPEAIDIQLGNDNPNDLRDRQMRDITQFSLPTLLRYEDRNAMGNSVESRLPFLDYRLVELGVALPTALKLRGGFGKWPIRKIMKEKIPDRIRLAHYKRGFDIPMRDLLNEGLGKSIRTALSGNPEVNAHYLKPGIRIDQAFSDSHLLNRRGAISEAITLLWLNRFFV